MILIYSSIVLYDMQIIQVMAKLKKASKTVVVKNHYNMLVQRNLSMLVTFKPINYSWL